MNKKIETPANGSITKGEAAARSFEKEVYQDRRCNIYSPFIEPTHASRYNPYKEKMNK